MTVDCRTCVHWYDDFLEMKLETARKDRLFFGCKIFGSVENFRAMADCPRYQPVDEPFAVCRTCGLPAPRVCVLLGECVNCTDTDLFCLRQCTGGELRTSCTHWVRLSTDGRAGVQAGEVEREYASESQLKTAASRRKLGDVYQRHLKRLSRRTRNRRAGR
jgi:hypothetical protein